ncbi:TPA: hypothetical protein ACNFOO_001799 [Acinetobacter baumannii]
MSPVEQGYMDVPSDQQSLLFTFGLSKVKNVYMVLKTVWQHDHTKYHA